MSWIDIIDPNFNERMEKAQPTEDGRGKVYMPNLNLSSMKNYSESMFSIETERALIVKKKWLDLILSGKKMLEMRSRPTKIRGRIGLIEAGSGLVVGTAQLIDSIEFSHKQLTELERHHQINDHSLLKKWRYSWVIVDPLRFRNPVQYKHPKGAVIWVKKDAWEKAYSLN